MQISALNPRDPVQQQLNSLHNSIGLLNQFIQNKVDARTFGGQLPAFYAPARHGVHKFRIPMALNDTEWVDSGIVVDPETGTTTIPGLTLPAMINNIDGGSAASIYLSSQALEGGAADSVYLRDQVLNGGVA